MRLIEVATISAVLVSATPSELLPQIQPPSNERVLMEAVKEAAFAELDMSNLERIEIVCDNRGLNRPIANGLAEALSERKIDVLITSEPTKSSARLDFDILGFDFHYEKGSSRGFLRKSRVRRQLKGQLLITIRNSGDGSIVSMDNLSLSYTDEIDPEMRSLLQSRDITELAPDAPGSGWVRFGEPALVTVVVGALVYLFFANR